jgi:hypothetical protein
MKKLLLFALVVFTGCVAEPTHEETTEISCRSYNPDGSLLYCVDFDVEIPWETFFMICEDGYVPLRCPSYNRIARCVVSVGTGHYYPPFTIEQVLRHCGGNVEVP